MPPITPDNAREMQLLGAAAKRRKREEAEKLALEHMVAHFSRALEKHTDLLNAESEQVALAAVKEIYNRLLGRAAQALEVSAPGGPVQIIVESASAGKDGGIAVSSESGEGSRPADS